MRLSLSYSLARGGRGGGAYGGRGHGREAAGSSPRRGARRRPVRPVLVSAWGACRGTWRRGGCSGEQEIGKMEVAVDDVCRPVEADRA